MPRLCTTITLVVLASSSSSTFPRTETFREAASLTVSFNSLLITENELCAVSYPTTVLIVLFDLPQPDLLEKVNLLSCEAKYAHSFDIFNNSL